MSSTPADSPSTGSAPALLLVDDRRENLVALEAALQPLGHPLLSATSGEEALRFLLHEDVAVIVLDVQMPGMDGFTVAEHIKQRERTKDIPIIFLTAISREEHHRMRGFEAGAVEYLFKPVEAELLRAKVSVFIELRMQNRLLEEQAATLARQSAELERSNADLEQFAYIASHDLQEPLRVVTGFVELLRAKLGDDLDDEARDWITRITRSAQGMTDLISGLLTYARTGAQPRAAEQVDLDAALKDVVAMLALDPGRVRGPELGAAMGSAEAVTTVLRNLLANAAKHSAATEPIEVASRPTGRWVTVSVTDRGHGVPEEELERVFGMFERLEGDPYPGTGLGLAVCRRLVERFGGQIWMENNVDKGVTVRFTLPAVAS